MGGWCLAMLLGLLVSFDRLCILVLCPLVKASHLVKHSSPHAVTRFWPRSLRVRLRKKGLVLRRKSLRCRRREGALAVYREGGVASSRRL